MSDPKMLAEAMAHEEDIAREARKLRIGEQRLTADLFLKLWVLLRRPIPQGFVRSLPKLEGKPYASTGISAVQVQITRMDNVLTPLWWWDSVEYHEDGKLAHVKVIVGDRHGGGAVLLNREAWGGVNRGSTVGNLYKGSYTNAAKVAFARIGPGWEVYLGATDFDPDTDVEAARAQGKGEAPVDVISARGVSSLMKLVTEHGKAGKLPLMLTTVGAESINVLTRAQHRQMVRLVKEGS